MNMNIEPCSICGGKDLNLVDGFYYCVECGTQDTTVRETLVEQKREADGTFAHIAKVKKIVKKIEKIKMSPEWTKWHTYNFILQGLTSELLALGAAPSVEKKILWIWTRYMKTFQEKEDIIITSQFFDEDNKAENIISSHQDDNSNDLDNSLLLTPDEVVNNIETGRNKRARIDRRSSVTKITKCLLFSILYVALNLDRSDIQLSHIFRFHREGRLSIINCEKFVPKELDLRKAKHWGSFQHTSTLDWKHRLRGTGCILMKTLNLGKPITPDIRKIVDNFVKELCLPKDFKDLVFSLIDLYPCDFSDGRRIRRKIWNKKRVKKYFIPVTIKEKQIPDYETEIMAYVVVALKMCFGLDDEYEIKISDAVDEINKKEDYPQSHKLGICSNKTQRLFSFREWSNYLKFRRIMLGKFVLPMAQKYHLEVDDHVFMEQLAERPRRDADLYEDVTTDILNKIPYDDHIRAIPFSEFLPTLTPFSDYIETILDFCQDPDIRMSLSEDFTRYSLKYACSQLKLPNQTCMIKGVTDANKKVQKPKKVLSEGRHTADFSMVFVRNCENKNWLKTKPPTLVHVTKTKEESDRDSDLGYNSNAENTSPDRDGNIEKTQIKVKQEDINKEEKLETIDEEHPLETIEEEDPELNIFDDKFDIIDQPDQFEVTHFDDAALQELNNSRINLEDLQNYQEDQNDDQSSEHEEKTITRLPFNPDTFDREQTIKELVLLACKKYKIPIPKKYKDREPVKRKSFIRDEAGCSKEKRRKVTKRGEAMQEVNKILNAYHSIMEKDMMAQLAETVETVFGDMETQDLDAMVVDHHEDNTLEQNSEKCLADSQDEPEDIVSNNKDQSEIMSMVDSDLFPEIDPNFDEKTHDIKQLYVKFRENFSIDDCLDDDDPEISEIIAKERPNLPPETEKVDKNDINRDDIKNKAKKLKHKMKQREKWKHLIDDHDKILKFNYWKRHYKDFCRYQDSEEWFETELLENMPSSFIFILHECANIIDSKSFMLYKFVQYVEEKMKINKL